MCGLEMAGSVRASGVHRATRSAALTLRAGPWPLRGPIRASHGRVGLRPHWLIAIFMTTGRSRAVKDRETMIAAVAAFLGAALVALVTIYFQVRTEHRLSETSAAQQRSRLRAMQRAFAL